MNVELEEEIERIAQAIRILEAELHRLAPYSPTPPQLAEQVATIVREALADTASRQPVIAEAGCGKGYMARMLADTVKAYIVCIEIDEDLIINAGPTLLIEPVVSDIHNPPIRKADLVYAYLLPRGVQVALERINADIIVSLDYAAEKTRPCKTLVLRGFHELHIYLKTRITHKTPKIGSTTDNTPQPTPY